MIGEAPFKIHSAAASVCVDNNKAGVGMTMPNYYYRQLFMIYVCASHIRLALAMDAGRGASGIKILSPGAHRVHYFDHRRIFYATIFIVAMHIAGECAQ